MRGCEVRRLTDNTVLLRLSRSDRIANYDKLGLSAKCDNPKSAPRPSRWTRAPCVFRAAQRIRFVAWQRLSDFASVLGEQQRHQLIDRCRWVSRRARSHVPTTREARRWSILNPSIIVLNKCKALINVCAMVRSVSL
jgi:hypothetical protein